MKNLLTKPIAFNTLPEIPGVYVMKDAEGRFLYIGKAGNLRRRVSSYFVRAHDARIEKLVSLIHSLEFHPTDTPIEALILEARLIKEHQPIYNIREKDGKSFLFVEFTKEAFPRVLLVRGLEKEKGERFGPFTSAQSIREALKIIRRIFPFNMHPPENIGTFAKPCFDYQVGMCPGTCIGAVGKSDYRKTVRNLRLFFEGKKERIVKLLEREMKLASALLQFEEADRLKRQLFALRHIQDVSLITEGGPQELSGDQVFRIEGYDISHISGTSAVGSMVVFYGDIPAKSEYRKFKIKTIEGSNDTGMLQEVLSRRLGNAWPLPQCILVDGGSGQVHAMEAVLRAAKIAIPVVGIAKGPERKRNDIIGTIPEGITENTLEKVRDEAHRFAVAYHRNLRGRRTLER